MTQSREVLASVGDGMQLDRSNVSLPLPKGDSYPLLQLPKSIAGYAASEASRFQDMHVFSDLADPHAWTQRLSGTRQSINEVANRLEEQYAKLLQQRRAQHEQLKQDGQRDSQERNRTE